MRVAVWHSLLFALLSLSFTHSLTLSTIYSFVLFSVSISRTTQWCAVGSTGILLYDICACVCLYACVRMCCVGVWKRRESTSGVSIQMVCVYCVETTVCAQQYSFSQFCPQSKQCGVCSHQYSEQQSVVLSVSMKIWNRIKVKEEEEKQIENLLFSKKKTAEHHAKPRKYSILWIPWQFKSNFLLWKWFEIAITSFATVKKWFSGTTTIVTSIT